MRNLLYYGLVAMILTGCGTERVSTSNADPGGMDAVAVQNRIVASHQLWAGTEQDLQAAQVLRAHALNGEYDACMQARGFTEFDFRDSIHRLPEPPDTGLVGLLEPEGIERAKYAVLAQAYASAFEYRANHPETEYALWNEEVDAATIACLGEARSADDEELEALVRPSGLDDLLAGWYGDETTQKLLLFDINGSPAAAYVDCMGSSGYGDGSLHESDEYSPSLMSRLRDEVTATAPEDWRILTDPEARAGSEQWRAFEEAEEAWLKADWSCRSGLIADHIADVADWQDRFVLEHSEQIDAVTRQWADIRTDAAALGWEPDRPFAR